MINIIEVLNKIHDSKAVALQSEVLELATFADPKQQIKKVEELNATTNKHVDAIHKAKQEAKTPVRKAVELSERIVRELESDKKEFTSKVKALGIDPSKLPQIKEFDKAITRTTALAKNIKKNSEDLK